MKFRPMVSVIAISLSLIVACEMGRRPIAFSEPIQADAEGLKTLFEEECIERRNLEIAATEAARLAKRKCDGLWRGIFEGVQGEDCYIKYNGIFRWQVSTFDGGEVSVALSWPIDAVRASSVADSRNVTCSIMVGSNHARDLEKAADLFVAESDKADLAELPVNGVRKEWSWSGNEDSCKDFSVGFQKPTKFTPDAWSLYFWPSNTCASGAPS